MPTADRSPRNNNISRIVKGLLALTERKQGDLADALGLSDSGMSRRLKGGEWSVDDVDAMARFFERPVSTFFTDPDDLFRRPDQQNGFSIWIDDPLTTGKSGTADDLEPVS